LNKNNLIQNQISRSIGGPQTVSSEDIIKNDHSSSNESDLQENSIETGPKD